MLKLHWPGPGLPGVFPDLCTELPGVRKRPEMVTISFLTFLLHRGNTSPGPYYRVPLLRAKNPLRERESKPGIGYIYSPGPI